MPPHSVTTIDTGTGPLLRYWRDVRGKSQLELSLETGVSQRHLSFIESGRSVPGRQTLMSLAQALEVPLRERNALLLAAGYAPQYAESPWDAVEMQSVTRAIERMLRQHEPYPALVMDRYWNVMMTNAAAPLFFGRFIDLGLHPKPRNMLHLMFDPAGMRPFIANWNNVASSLLHRVRHEAVGHVIDGKTDQLIESLLAYPDVDVRGKQAESLSESPALPVIPIDFHHEGEVFSFFSMVTTVGTPQSIAAQELRIECLFTTNDETETRYARLMKPNAAS